MPFVDSGAATRGLPGVLGQAIRTRIHSRLALGMRHYARAYPEADILLMEPDGADPVLQRAPPFGYAARAGAAQRSHLLQFTGAYATEPGETRGRTAA